MSDKPRRSALSVLLSLIAAFLVIALGGGLFLDYVAAKDPSWDASAKSFAARAARLYFDALVAFEKGQK